MLRDHVAVGKWKKARGGQRRKRGACGEARGDSRFRRARGNAREAPRSRRRRARSSDDGRGAIPRGVGRHALVEKSCGGLKSGAGTEKPSRDDAGTRVPPRRRRRQLIPPGTRLRLTRPEHLRGPFPGPPPPRAFAGLRPRKPQWSDTKATCLVGVDDGARSFGGLHSSSDISCHPEGENAPPSAAPNRRSPSFPANSRREMRAGPRGRVKVAGGRVRRRTPGGQGRARGAARDAPSPLRADPPRAEHSTVGESAALDASAEVSSPDVGSRARADADALAERVGVGRADQPRTLAAAPGGSTSRRWSWA